MKKVGIITFHAAHNYGSMLQAYALQQTVLRLGYDCEIINFRTERQKEMYRLPWQRGKFLGKIICGMMYLPIMRQLKHKQQLFESFLNNEFRLSEMEYNSSDELKTAGLKYDCYISGSDQIWNTSCWDFNNAYFLDFVNKKRRIAYAPSLGPNPSLPKDKKTLESIKIALNNYDYISVREGNSAIKIKELTGMDVPVVLDPTLLLDSSEWLTKAGDVPIVKGDYVFLYSPWPNAETWQYASQLAKWCKSKVIVSNINNGFRNNTHLLDPNLHPYLGIGPNEFLNLCRHAKYVVGQSFHLAVFCIQLRKPFVIVGGAEDSRVTNLLSLTGLMSRNISYNEDILIKFENAVIDFDNAQQALINERNKCLKWLNNCLSCNDIR